MNVGAYSAIILVPAWSCLVIITLTLMSPWARNTGKNTNTQMKINKNTKHLDIDEPMGKEDRRGGEEDDRPEQNH